MQFNPNELLFLPLGGSNEIGMNVNLYHYQGKWLIVDCGAGFAGDDFPGIAMLAPDLNFVYQRLPDVLGIVLTHAHEDHLGSVGYLWDQLQLPIYATPFTAGMVRSKLQEKGVIDRAKLIEVPEGSSFEIGPFALEMIQLTHSVPEMNALMVRTAAGNIFHTGDWKFDPNPVVGNTSDFDALTRIGNEGVLAMVCDSTNVFNDRVAGSEGELLPSLTKLISEAKGMVCVTTFASNVARMDTIARAAEACGRRVMLAGWSLRRIAGIARETGYLQQVPEFVSDKEVRHIPRDKLLVICTGCQGEPNAAMTKIANGAHPEITLTKRDTVIFSSKIIPGNEKKLFALFNKFVRLGCEVLTEKDHFVHVSGHPSRQELMKMYELVKPQVAVPVHGEPVHLHEHVKLAKSLGVPKTVEIQNGQVVKLAPGEPLAIGSAPFGYLGVDGMLLQPQHGPVMKMRRRMMNDGIALVSLAVDKDGGLVSEPQITVPGLLDPVEDKSFLFDMADAVEDVLSAQHDFSMENIIKKTRNIVQRMLKEDTGKQPFVEVQVLWI